MMAALKSKYDEFLFKSYAYEKESGALSLHYAFAGGPEFEERIVLPLSARGVLSKNEEQALDRAFRLIFLLAGVSYYKAYVPPKLRCVAFPLDAVTAKFLEKVYLNGLGEFAFRNGIEIDPHFAVDTAEVPAPVSLDNLQGSLVPVGGGKDSIVTIECLRKLNKNIILFASGTEKGLAAPIRNTLEASNLPSIVVKRTISQNLLEINKGDALNGHVPITAILSGIAVACSILHGLDSVVFSNENSASAPNIKIGDREVNHQYSKSLAFEKDFADILRDTLSPDIRYFSFLRPLTEAEIARRFASLEAYHPIFRSCNTAFRQDEKSRGKNWCCDCPKCRFVFLALAPFMDREKLIGIFGKNLLDDADQADGYKELCGLSAYKPFECVGEVEESALLMEKLYRMTEWKNDAIVARVGDALARDEKVFEKKFDALFINRADHRLPEEYLEVLDACR